MTTKDGNIIVFEVSERLTFEAGENGGLCIDLRTWDYAIGGGDTVLTVEEARELRDFLIAVVSD